MNKQEYKKFNNFEELKEVASSFILPSNEEDLDRFKESSLSSMNDFFNWSENDFYDIEKYNECIENCEEEYKEEECEKEPVEALSLDFVFKGTFEDQKRWYFRLQYSYGWPTFEARIWKNKFGEWEWEIAFLDAFSHINVPFYEINDKKDIAEILIDTYFIDTNSIDEEEFSEDDDKEEFAEDDNEEEFIK